MLEMLDLEGFIDPNHNFRTTVNLHTEKIVEDHSESVTLCCASYHILGYGERLKSLAT